MMTIRLRTECLQRAFGCSISYEPLILHRLTLKLAPKNGQVGRHENVSFYDNCFRENQGRAPALQVSRLNHTSAASGVAYAETCGATTLSNWTDVGPKVFTNIDQL
jgi:hypothetical protein